MALGDQRRVPGPTVLLVEGDQFAARRNPGVATGLGSVVFAQRVSVSVVDATYLGCVFKAAAIW
jgi:hypothetical protein